MSKFDITKPGAGWGVFQLAKGKTLPVPMSVHEASRRKLVQLFHQQGVTQGLILLQGGDEQCQYDSDTEILFRQDSWFNYLFGVKESGMYGVVDVSSGKTTLFVPKLPDEYRIWCGTIYPPEHFRLSYAVDEVVYTEDISNWIHSKLASAEAKLHVMNGVNSDSGLTAKPARFEGDADLWSSGRVEEAVLYNLLAQCRVIKSQEEIDVMRYVANVASNAHVQVMRSIKEFSFEYELEAKFLYEIYRNGGCRKCAYTSICACGPNGAVLHYGHAAAPNDRGLRPTDIALLDMGAEYHGYVSDITCSFPVSGKFTADQKIIYEGVLNAQKAVFANMTAGTAWTDCHKFAEMEILKALMQVGILHNESLDFFQENLFGPIFFPHGLGHLIGCDTHDVGGYIPGTPERSSRPGLSKLRTARVLEAGMVLTNEPGCYFIGFLLDKALEDPSKAPYINKEVLDRFRGFGGVRLEDVVLVTAEGAESLSTCPRTIEEIESVIAGGAWPPAHDAAPELKRRWTKFDGEKMVDIQM